MISNFFKLSQAQFHKSCQDSGKAFARSAKVECQVELSNLLLEKVRASFYGANLFRCAKKSVDGKSSTTKSGSAKGSDPTIYNLGLRDILDS
jgi:hypothetical protein